MLDVEILSGICPKADIVVYFAKPTEKGWISALDAAIHDEQRDIGVISISWGSPEDTGLWTTQGMHQVNESLLDAACLGITVCIATGDDGSSCGVPDGHAHIAFPASSPYCLAVGGTTIPAKGGKGNDIVWKEGGGVVANNGGSSGGGVSSVFPRPSWQKNVTIKSVNSKAIRGRCIPDLAANADWTASPYLLMVDGKAMSYGGTSAAAPLIAGLFVLINADRGKRGRAGFVTPLLYQRNRSSGKTVGANACKDVVSGNNSTAILGGYTGPGYDAASGWGTPLGISLAKSIP